MTAKSIVEMVAKEAGLKPEVILSRVQSPYVVKARFRAMALCRSHLKMSYPQIGRLFGRHHTTVQNAISRCPNPELSQMVRMGIKTITMAGLAEDMDNLKRRVDCLDTRMTSMVRPYGGGEIGEEMDTMDWSFLDGGPQS